MRNSANVKELTPAGKYAKEHWAEILAISSTLAGAVILLLIRYHRKRKSDEGIQLKDKELAILEGEALTSTKPDAPLILELMPDVARHIGDITELTTELSEGLPEETKVLRKGTFWKRKVGNPKALMKAVPEIK